MQAKTIDKSEFFKPGQDDYERGRGRKGEREMGRAGQRTRRRLRLRRERGQFKSHCIKRQEKPFNLLVTKICYLLNCAIKNENANEPRQDEAALRQEGRVERERKGRRRGKRTRIHFNISRRMGSGSGSD